MPLTDERRAEIAALSGRALDEAVARAMGDEFGSVQDHDRSAEFRDRGVCVRCGADLPGYGAWFDNGKGPRPLEPCVVPAKPYATATGDEGWVLFGRMWEALLARVRHCIVLAPDSVCGQWAVEFSLVRLAPRDQWEDQIGDTPNDAMARAYLIAKEAQGDER